KGLHVLQFLAIAAVDINTPRLLANDSGGWGRDLFASKLRRSHAAAGVLSMQAGDDRRITKAGPFAFAVAGRNRALDDGRWSAVGLAGEGRRKFHAGRRMKPAKP